MAEEKKKEEGEAAVKGEKAPEREAAKEEKKEVAEKKEEKPGEGKGAEKPKAEAKPEEKKAEAKVEEKKEEKAPGAEAKKPEKKKKGRIAIVHVYSSKNDTIVTATDVSGAETLSWSSGGAMVKSSREEGRPYAAMQAAIKVVNDLKEKGIDIVHIRIRAPGGNRSKTPGSGAQAVVRAVARARMRVGKIIDVTPVPSDSMKRKGGRRGRRV